MTQTRILTAGPSITQREIDYVHDAVANGWNTNCSAYIDKFEKTFAAYLGVSRALSTSSCTGALHLGLSALGVGPGDEVIVPEVTWIATASAVRYCGATPVFVDIDPDSWCLDPASVRQAITERTRAIVPVHLYGHPADMPAIMDLAGEYGLKVLEDAAPALGAQVDNRRVGSIGHLAAFSFQGAKIMTTGEGGMLVTDDEDLYRRACRLADHGRDPNRPFVITETGYKYRMSNLQAALGLAQIERIEELVARKRKIFEWYQQRLADRSGVSLNGERPGARNIYWMTSIVLEDAFDRNAVMRSLKDLGIESRPFFSPISSFGMYEKQAKRNPVAYRISAQGINLPSGHNLTQDDVDRVAGALMRSLDRCPARAA